MKRAAPEGTARFTLWYRSDAEVELDGKSGTPEGVLLGRASLETKGSAGVSKRAVAIESVQEPVHPLDFRPSCGGRSASMGDAAHLLSMTDDRIRLWTPRELSDFTGIPIRTLADWRTTRSRRRGLGLPFVALSPRNVRYREEDIVAFIAGKLVAPTDGKDD